MKKLDSQIEQAVAALKQGGVVAYPTGTAYGLAVDATSAKGIKKLFWLKGRRQSKAVSVIFPSLAAAGRAVSFGRTGRTLARRYLPGALTLVLPLKSRAASWRLLAGSRNRLGVRWPDHRLARLLARKLNRPITATSANLSGKPTAYSVAQIKRQFPPGRRPDYFLDGGRLKPGSISTVVAVEGGRLRLIREGDIPYREILETLERAK